MISLLKDRVTWLEESWEKILWEAARYLRHIIYIDGWMGGWVDTYWDRYVSWGLVEVKRQYFYFLNNEGE